MEEIVFEKLRVYQNGIKLVTFVYLTVKNLPTSEQYNVTSQFQRAAVSVVLNIAESQGKNTLADKRNYLSIAKGSAYEMIALTDVSFALHYFSQDKRQEMRSQVFALIKQLNAFIKYNSK